jgi:hypothetical protein
VIFTKAVVFEKPMEVKAQEVPKPKIEHPRDVILRIKSSAGPVHHRQGEAELYCDEADTDRRYAADVSLVRLRRKPGQSRDQGPGSRRSGLV